MYTYMIRVLAGCCRREFSNNFPLARAVTQGIWQGVMGGVWQARVSKGYPMAQGGVLPVHLGGTRVGPPGSESIRHLTPKA